MLRVRPTSNPRALALRYKPPRPLSVPCHAPNRLDDREATELKAPLGCEPEHRQPGTELRGCQRCAKKTSKTLFRLRHGEDPKRSYAKLLRMTTHPRPSPV